MAIHSGKPAGSITLIIFGGVSGIGKEPDQPGEEIRISFIGALRAHQPFAAYASRRYIGLQGE